MGEIGIPVTGVIISVDTPVLVVLLQPLLFFFYTRNLKGDSAA